jgi:hypothetical protein
MHRFQRVLGSEQMPCPWEGFDLIGGTGMGG